MLSLPQTLARQTPTEALLLSSALNRPASATVVEHRAMYHLSFARIYIPACALRGLFIGKKRMCHPFRLLPATEARVQFFGVCKVGNHDERDEAPHEYESYGDT